MATIEAPLKRSLRRIHPGIRVLSTSRTRPFIQFYWKLYLLKHHREDLLAHTEYFDVETLDADAVPADAIILTNSDDVVERTLIASGRFAETRKIPEADDSTAFALLEKRR